VFWGFRDGRIRPEGRDSKHSEWRDNMATITTDRAAEMLNEAVQKAQPDDLAEIYNELFPESPTTEEKAIAGPQVLLAKITKHIQRGLEIEEILDLWNVVFPEHHGIRLEEDGRLQYNENHQPLIPAE
jgi:hypothetical protein